ncbi:MAG: RNA polymerase sigma factor [Fibrobacterales bacterium]
MTDSELIHEIKAGSKPALDQLTGRYLDGVRRMVMYTIGNKGCVDDVVQESFIALQKSLLGFKEDAAFSTWLFGLVRNVSLQYVRKHLKPVEAFEEALHAPATESVRPEVAHLNSALQKLEGKYREPLVLKEMEGFRYDEIAAILGIKEGTVKSRIHEAKQKMIVLLNRGGDHG